MEAVGGLISGHVHSVSYMYNHDTTIITSIVSDVGRNQ